MCFQFDGPFAGPFCLRNSSGFGMGQVPYPDAPWGWYIYLHLPHFTAEKI